MAIPSTSLWSTSKPTSQEKNTMWRVRDCPFKATFHDDKTRVGASYVDVEKKKTLASGTGVLQLQQATTSRRRRPPGC